MFQDSPSEYMTPVFRANPLECPTATSRRLPGPVNASASLRSPLLPPSYLSTADSPFVSPLEWIRKYENFRAEQRRQEIEFFKREGLFPGFEEFNGEPSTQPSEQVFNSGRNLNLRAGRTGPHSDTTAVPLPIQASIRSNDANAQLLSDIRGRVVGLETGQINSVANDNPGPKRDP
jgi:hypothetical protein